MLVTDFPLALLSIDRCKVTLVLDIKQLKLKLIFFLKPRQEPRSANVV